MNRKNRLSVIIFNNEKEKKQFVENFNNGKPSPEFLESCKKASKLFGLKKEKNNTIYLA